MRQKNTPHSFLLTPHSKRLPDPASNFLRWVGHPLPRAQVAIIRHLELQRIMKKPIRLLINDPWDPERGPNPIPTLLARYFKYLQQVVAPYDEAAIIDITKKSANALARGLPRSMTGSARRPNDIRGRLPSQILVLNADRYPWRRFHYWQDYNYYGFLVPEARLVDTYDSVRTAALGLMSFDTNSILIIHGNADTRMRSLRHPYSKKKNTPTTFSEDIETYTYPPPGFPQAFQVLNLKNLEAILSLQEELLNTPGSSDRAAGAPAPPGAKSAGVVTVPGGLPPGIPEVLRFSAAALAQRSSAETKNTSVSSENFCSSVSKIFSQAEAWLN